MMTRRMYMLVYHLSLLLFAARITSGGIACLNNPCLHGICIDDVNSTYSCYCVDGYTGVQCQTNWDECWSNPCLNGGFCLDGVASYNCSCPDGFIGDNCEINYDECESNPCSNNGTCIDLANGYICSCLPGFSGDHCQVDVAVCNSTEEVRCYNGGHCIEGPGFKFYCKCLPGWAGPNCEIAIDECESNPCQNGGVCIDIHADYMCACTFGFTGKSCEVEIEFCDENSCSNNALCVVEDETRVCYCVPDYHGEKCELQYDECLLGPRCMNGGTCIDGVDNFTCSCPPRLTGMFCECLILDNNTLECDYVSPSPLPGVTETVTTLLTMIDNATEIMTTVEVTSGTVIEQETTTIFEDITTTEISTFEESFTTNYSEPQSSVTTEGIEINVTIETDNSVSETTEATILDHTTTDKVKTETEIIETEGTEYTTEYITEISTDTEVSIISTEKSGVTENYDTTTEELFTDSPSEQTVTDFSTTHSTPLETDLTSESASSVTTVVSECSDNVCNNHGTCASTLHGIRCHCKFNYGGRYCEEKISIIAAAFGGNSYLTHKLNNSSTINIEFNARTLITDGQIMYVDIAKGVYIQLYMVAGLLKFKFSCGYQTMLLSELKTFVNKGYSMKIEARLGLYAQSQHCNATLHLNDTVAMSGGQVANFSYLHQNTTLYFGNFPSGLPHVIELESRPFIGCIRDLIVNNEKREIFSDAYDGAEVSECSSLSCLSGPCFNGGSCHDHEDNYTCACSNGWTGDHCEISVCDRNPCQFGGSCVRHPGSGFICLCPYGKHGIFCEYNVEITRPSFSSIPGGVSSYLKYSLPQAVNSERFDLRFRFQTSDMDQISLLAFVGQNGIHHSRSQHLAVTFVKGYIMLTWNLGYGARRIFTPRALGSRRGGHWVRVGRRGRTAWLSVDGSFNVSGNAPGTDTKMAVVPYMYIGGHPSLEFTELPHDLPLHSGWKGCIWEVGSGGGGMSHAVSARGVGQCGVAHCTGNSCHSPHGVCIHHPATYGCICNEGWFGATCSMDKNPCDRAHTSCKGRCVISATPDTYCDCPYGTTGKNCDIEQYPTDVLFTGIRSFIRLIPRSIRSVSLSLELEIKPEKARGLILYAETPHFYTALSLQGALLEYRWTERVSGVSSVVVSGVVLSVGTWHTVRAGRYGSKLYVWVDGSLAAAAMMAHAEPHTADNATILLGGAEDLSSLPFDVMSGPPESYSGCIRNLHVNNLFVPLEKENIKAGMNVEDCDGTPCGGEVCGSGTCVVQEGQAHCSCGTGKSTGKRCRRNVQCIPSTCSQPRGSCRKGKCVCASGYYGINCEEKINVTIPQFNGDSLLLLDGNHRVGGQRLEKSSTLPEYLALNFTTPEPNGLLIWITMDNNYIGVGLNEGYLKLVRFIRNETSKNKPQTKSLTTAGILADAEWHILVMKINSNLSLQVDGNLVFNEVTGVKEDTKYDTVGVFLGGATGNEITTKHFKNYIGCIGDIATSHHNSIKNYTEIYSENIKSCQLLP